MSHPISILLVTEDFPPSLGGTATFLFNLARATGAAVKVLAPYVAECEEIDTEQPFATSRLRLRRRLGFIQYLRETRRLLDRDGVDVLLHGHFSAAFIGAAFLLPRRQRLAVLIHGNDLYRFLIRGPFWRTVALAALRRCDLILVNSSFNRDRLLEIGMRSETIAVLHPGVDTTLFAPSDGADGLPPSYGLTGKQVLLTVGRLIERKNHKAVLDALAALRSEFPDLYYVIVGAGPERNALEAQARNLGVSDSVLFRGESSLVELVAWYNACDIFVLPARLILERGDVEGFGIACAEASACGKPVLAGNTGGMSDAVRHGETGLLAPPEDREAIVEALRYLLTHPEEADSLGKAGREFVERELAWPRVAERFDRLMEGLRTANHKR